MQMQHAQPASMWMMSGYLIEDMGGSIRRTIINSNNLKMRIILRQQRLNAAANIALFIACGNDYRNQRMIGLKRWICLNFTIYKPYFILFCGSRSFPQDKIECYDANHMH